MTKKFHWSMWLVLVLIFAGRVLAEGDLIQITQDFSKDPGWEWKNNRIVAENPPTINQDFGWSPTHHTGAGPGEIGGRIWMSRTPAYYALPLNRPLSFKDKFSFSGRIAFMPTGGGAAAYLGFFNHKLQGWRVWNSMAMRLGGETSGLAAFGADSMTAEWQASGGIEGYLHVPADGKPHRFSFAYDPVATPGEWPDPRLKNYLTNQRQTVDQILERAHQDEPDLTREALEQRLVAAHAAGLIYYIQRTGHESVIGRTPWNGKFWSLAERFPAGAQGAMIIEVDDSGPFKMYIDKAAHDRPVFMDRFGLFNMQLYHQYIDLYIGDLTVDGHKVDLSKDPGWEDQGNRVRFVEQDFHRQDYGYSETNWAGEGIGEIGGQFSSAESVDPHSGYYVDDIGELTLDDTFSFSGNICFVHDSTDAGMQIGYFNSSNLAAKPDPDKRFSTSANSIGVFIEGSATAGKKLMPQFTTANHTVFHNQELAIRPTKEPRTFAFRYEPNAGDAGGRMTVTLDGESSTLSLTADQRAEAGPFDRFGIANLRGGGKYVVAYFDDLSYTARRPKDFKPVFHKQEAVKVPYPKGGRAF